MQEKTFRPSRWQLLPPVLSGSALKILAIVTMLIDTSVPSFWKRIYPCLSDEPAPGSVLRKYASHMED